MISTQRCQLCLAAGPLRRSHVIPNAFFKRIKKRNAGKLVHFDDSKESVIDYSIESWWEHLLCDACEARIGQLDKYGVEAFERVRKVARRRSDGALLKPLDYVQMKRFLTSLLWRVALATHPAFHQVTLPSAYTDELRRSLLGDLALPPNQLTCRLELLYDPTPTDKGGFNANHLVQLISSPRARLRGDRVSFLFILDGLLIEIFTPDAPHRVWRSTGVLKDAPQLFLPPKNLFKVPELRQLLLIGFGKHVIGKESPSIRRRHR